LIAAASRSPPEFFTTPPSIHIKVFQISSTFGALAPVADLPVVEVVSAIYICADLTLGLGEVGHDYLRQPNRETLGIEREKSI